MASEADLEWVRAGGRRYLVGTPRGELRKWERELVDERGWDKVRAGLEVKICSGPDGNEVFLLCRSESRKRKEEAMHDRFDARIVDGLEKLRRRLERAGQPADRTQVERQIGRLLERNRRAAAKYRIKVHDDPTRLSGLRLTWCQQSRTTGAGSSHSTGVTV